MMIDNDSYKSFLMLLRIWVISSAFRTYYINPFDLLTFLASQGKYICGDINASVHFSKFPNKLKQREIKPAHKTKSWIFNKDYMGISIHKTELANCGRSDQPAISKSLDFGT